MQPLETRIKKTIREHNLLGSETVVIGVSGGPDSMALLLLLARLAADLDLTLVAVYVDHGLRPLETPYEIELARGLAAKFGIVFQSDVIPTRDYAETNKLSLEHAGRLLRYDCLGKIAADSGAAKICVAHTADDQAEEILLRLIRGSGHKGLSGMMMMRDNKVVRPLLTTSKAELLNYLEHNTIAYCKDSSNLDRTFLRNRVRLDLLPYLAAEFNPNISATLRQTAAILQDEEAFLEEKTIKACQWIIAPAPSQAGQNQPAPVNLDLKKLLAESRAIQRRVIEKVCWLMASQPRFLQIEQILALAVSHAAGDTCHLPEGLRVKKKKDQLCFSYPLGRIQKRGNLSGNEPNSFAYTVTAPGEVEILEIGVRMHFQILNQAPTPAEMNTQAAEYLAFDHNNFPISIRSPQPSDHFQPLGGPGGKKVSKFLKDLKVPKEKRWQVPVLVAQEKIIALAGLRIDHNFRITTGVNRVLKVRWEGL